MTAIRGYVAPTTESDALGVHSLDQFVLTVPDASVAQDFYGQFGLDVRRDGNALAIKTFGHEHRWGSVVEGAKAKALHHLSFGCYADDLPRLKARIEEQGVKLIDPPPGFESNGFWFRNHEGVLDRSKGRAESFTRQEIRKPMDFCSRRRRGCKRPGKSAAGASASAIACADFHARRQRIDDILRTHAWLASVRPRIRSRCFHAWDPRK